MEKRELLALIAIIGCSFLFHLAFISSHPFYLDESLYMRMIAEQQEHLTIVPTYLGYEAGWKPPLFFWVYAFITKISAWAGNTLELVYRLPNILFAMANIALVYLIFRKNLGKDETFYATAIYAFSFIFVYTNERLLLDAFSMTPMAAAIYFYTDAKEGKIKAFALGGFLTFLAFLAKSVVAFVIPAAVIAYFFQHDRKTLFNPWFIASLAIAIPAALGIHYFGLEKNAAEGIFAKDILGKLSNENSFENRIGISLLTSLVALNVLLVAPVLGFWHFWKENYLMSAWLALGIFAFLGGSMMPWYFYVVLPPIVFFTVKSMQRDPKTGKLAMDGVFKLIFALIITVNVIIAYIWFCVLIDLSEEKTAGKLIVNKENVAIIGEYGPASIVLAYKLGEEQMRYGETRDFGWIIVNMEAGGEELIRDFAGDYWTGKYEVNEENFARLFWTKEIFRKKTGVEKFDYLVISGFTQPEIEGYGKIYSGKQIAVYRKS